jgi:predicted dehydrogenase
MPHDQLSRRKFLLQGGAAAAALTASSYARVEGANDRIGLGFIGYGQIGKRHVNDCKGEQDLRLVAVAETHRGRLDEAVAGIDGGARAYADFRGLLDDPDVDGVFISTPDHWHALMTLMACAAGKDVYVEKPLSLFVREGRWMVDAARRHGRVVQVGTQQRSGAHYRRARDLIRSGHLGKIVSVRARAFRNIMPGYGRPADRDPPAELDWDLWLGPAPARQYNPNRGIYHFRWFWDYSGGQMTNLGQHALDIVDWALGVRALEAVTSAGGRFALEDNGETPDTQDVLFEFPGWTASWSHREASRGETPRAPLEFFGTAGSLTISRQGFQVTPDPDEPPENSVPRLGGEHPVGGPRRVPAAGAPRERTRPVRDDTGSVAAQLSGHIRNFVDCMRTREAPVSDLESGHRVATLCHLANLSLRLGRKLRWDAEKEAIEGDPEAAAALERPYRAPWDAELRALRAG